MTRGAAAARGGEGGWRWAARWRDHRRTDLALLALLAACVVFPGLGARDLWNPDEPRYGEVAREMRESGSFLVPQFNHRLYTQKPPLMFWSIAACAAVLGRLDEVAVRLPSALAAIGSVLLVHALGRRLFDRRAAWIAAAVFLTSAKILWQARVGQIDMLLTFLVLCAVFCWIEGVLERRPALSYLFFAFAGLATLAKGPVGLLPPLLSLLAFMTVTRDRQALRDLRLVRGLLLWAVIVLLWLAPAIAVAGRAYADEILVGQNVARFFAPTAHLRPSWYFGMVLPIDFLPWSFFLPAALAGARWLDARQRRWVLMLLCWVAVTLIFFSLSPGKRTVYILTMYPALALLSGAGLAALSRAGRRARAWLAVPAGALAVLLWGIALAAPAAATTAFVLALRPERAAQMVTAIAAGVAVTYVALFVGILPRLDSELSLRPLAERVARDLPESYELASLQEMEGGLLFYGSGSARELWSAEELHSFLASDRRFWLVVDPDVLGMVTLPPGLPLDLVARQGTRDDGVRIFSAPTR
ncbi:MAG TPA: glycosyltransferase family 39 protein [Thermoanaerobaculia bacterium]|nr:glycosyltransferase family 39 protein [Thermoanaerobaculia bacterium]